jgi:uncharacterized protein (DUF2267 family)
MHGDFLSTNIASLDRAVENVILWLSDIQKELGWDSRENVYAATKAVLQAIRDRLPIQEVVHLSANLPLVMKGMLMDGYDLTEKPARLWTQDLFFELIEEYYNPYKRNAIHPEDAVQAVVRVLNRKMSGGEMCKVAATMPLEIKDLFKKAGVEIPETSKMPKAAA